MVVPASFGKKRSVVRIHLPRPIFGSALVEGSELTREQHHENAYRVINPTELSRGPRLFREAVFSSRPAQTGRNNRLACHRAQHRADSPLGKKPRTCMSIDGPSTDLKVPTR